MLNKIVGALGQVAEAGGSIVGIRSGTAEPSFTVERSVGSIEIRRYELRIAAETTIDADEEKARSEGFRRLAGYIFGGNTTKTKIAMTAPVAAQRDASGQWVIRFFMPAEDTMDTLPTPNDDRVRLVTVPAERVAVLKFSGTASLDAIASRTDELLNTLRDNNITTTSTPFTWFYDPPWTLPFRRRNEVVISLGAAG
ncbi:MAG: heme-binding protein [Mycobacterium sp.]